NIQCYVGQGYLEPSDEKQQAMIPKGVLDKPTLVGMIQAAVANVKYAAPTLQPLFSLSPVASEVKTQPTKDDTILAATPILQAQHVPNHVKVPDQSKFRSCPLPSLQNPRQYISPCFPKPVQSSTFWSLAGYLSCSESPPSSPPRPSAEADLGIHGSIERTEETGAIQEHKQPFDLEDTLTRNPLLAPCTSSEGAHAQTTAGANCLESQAKGLVMASSCSLQGSMLESFLMVDAEQLSAPSVNERDTTAGAIIPRTVKTEPLEEAGTPKTVDSGSKDSRLRAQHQMHEDRLTSTPMDSRVVIDLVEDPSAASGSDATRPPSSASRTIYLSSVSATPDSNDFIPVPTGPPNYQTLAPILRAAYALSFATLSTFCKQRLREIWPSELSQLSADPVPYAEDTIVLARSHVLGTGFYELVRSPTYGEDQLSENLGEDSQCSSLFRQSAGISKQDILPVMTTRNKLNKEWTQTTLSLATSEHSCLWSDGADPCVSGSDSREHWHALVMNPQFYSDGMIDPLLGLQRLAEHDWAALGYCNACVHSRKVVIALKRQQLWNQLPTWLGLE
ncbi:hypothetical protein PHLCEN_2v86, partial [Hermanssonia centrifuga]